MRDWLSHRAAATPDDLAVIDADTDTRWSYSGLDAAVDETAGRLANLGVDAGDQVGTLLPRTFLGVCLLHAAQRLGVTLVPLNHRLTAEELAAQIDQLELTLVVCDIDTEPAAVEAVEEVPIASVDEPQWAAVKSFKDVEPAAIEPVEWQREEPQLIVFTSGSTGRPKPVVLTMGNLLSSAIASAFRLGVDPADRWLLTLSLYHVGGIAPIFRSTLYGTAVVVRSDFDPGQAADDLDRYDVTVVSLVPTMLKQMLDRRGTLSDSLRVVLLGGAPADDALLQRCENYSVPVHPTYGMTETASQVATARPTDAFDRPGTVGRPLLWTEVTVLGDNDEPVAPGESGELVVSGPTVTPGYYGEDGEAFCPYGLRTGDIGYRTEDGSLFVVNRIDDRITSGGETIDPGAIVAVLTDHAAIEAAAVVGVPDEQWGERVTALVVSTDDDLSAEAVDSHCREHLAGFKCPKTSVFADELPRTASGSVDRPAVREAVTAAIEDASVAAEPDTDVDDADETEPPIESVDAAAVDDDDDGEPGIADRRPPSPMSPAEEPTTTPTDTEPIPDAESDAVNDDAASGADDDAAPDVDDDATDNSDGE
ncbi:o-succinylbenzoate--CoA ligase [Halonotius aquaticus]|uniref:O-succinylbenzoate--CoA ligase n=1 Tax=Halonotius aquaticus TaxID=2216978 RepID=A0A3A6PWI7_9EURY|nr:o-succinylbenzoate--CoA ligase [Halonotius aquaticus]RJX43707.1 o-succinylbenzoate--CoA ligase [Halonotius aquaticus]